jgi:serine/threonine-protein kinase
MKQIVETRTIGRYIVSELVGSGGLGEVFRATHSQSGETVALKRLHDHYQNDKKLLGLFHKEILIHSRVSHKHCVKFFSADLTAPDAHIVTEFIDGYNCHNLIRKIGAVPPLVACAIMLDALQGLEHLHCLDIIHSDMTPSNIMVERTGRVVLADFGLSCHLEVEDYQGMTVGTPGYQAPERLIHAPMTTLADIYAAGIILYELIKGQRLFAEAQPEKVHYKMKHLEFDWIRTGSRDFDRLMTAVLKTALAYKPQKRFPSPREFMYALYQCLKMFDVRYTRRAILQWLGDVKLSELPAVSPQQRIYIT